jgi:UDP-N-acetylglucosamine 2-epimerase (non-hydrolysing)
LLKENLTGIAMKPVVVVAGTRPEIIKMAPIIRALEKAKLPFLFVHCAQHYDYNMAQQFIEELKLPTPNAYIKIKLTSPANQTGQIIIGMDRFLSRNEASIVLAEGDTTTVLAASLAANKRKVPVGHVEAGLRSYDLRMAEEHNRRICDHISQYLFAPTDRAKANLEKENVLGKIYVTGNTVIDAVNQHMQLAEKKSGILREIPFEKFALATAHRAENVDDLGVLQAFTGVFSESPIPIVYPMHPRTKKRLKEKNMYAKMKRVKNLLILPPLGYLDFLVLMKKSDFIITDSGGIQEEATAPAIRKTTLVMRRSTERQEAVEAGFATIVGTDKESILKAMKDAVDNPKQLPKKSPFGEGFASEKTVEILKKDFD